MGKKRRESKGMGKEQRNVIKKGKKCGEKGKKWDK